MVSPELAELLANDEVLLSLALLETAVAGIVEVWDRFSQPQKVCACGTVGLVFAALFLYVPYFVPTSRSYEYSWIWKPVVYEDPLTKEILGQVDSDEMEDELRGTGIALAPEWRKNSIERVAHYSRRRAQRNAAIVLALGVLLHFTVGAAEQIRMYMSQDAAKRT